MPMFKDVLIVCHANICRSPMAEAMFKADTKVRAAGIVMHSAGLFAKPGREADATVKSILLERNVDVGEHRSRLLTGDMIGFAQLILVMEDEQVREIVRREPSSRGKVHLLGKWNNVEIYDPYKQAEAVYKGCAELVEQSVANWIKKIC